MEEKNKKVLVPTIIAVVTLVLLTVGATYAYFRVAANNNFGTPKIDASTPSIGSVALSTGSNLTMNLTAEQMMEKDTSVTYYASPYGTTTDAYTENIGTATVTGSGSYTCTYTLTIDDNSNSLYDKFQNNYANKSTGQVVLTVNGVEYDFNTAGLFPKTISGTMSGLTSASPQYITAQLKLVNSKSIDQSNLSGQNITLTFGVEDFSCTADTVATTLCIRATQLHEIDSSDRGNSRDLVSFGGLGTKGEELQPGDALTCDVNGDGGYDEATERFYYVSDYYNTTTKEFEDDKATLIYYKNIGEEIEYYAANENWHGPVTAITQLPTTSEWTNVNLINPIRKIINNEGGDTVRKLVNYEELALNNWNNPNFVPVIETHNLPTAFDYSGYSARLVTYEEMNYAMNNCGSITGDRCYAFSENSNYWLYDDFGGDYWTETPIIDGMAEWDEEYREWNAGEGTEMMYISFIDDYIYLGGGAFAESQYFVRPVIEVYKTDIDN